MRDQQYYARLSQIRQKYGYTDINTPRDQNSNPTNLNRSAFQPPVPTHQEMKYNKRMDRFKKELVSQMPTSNPEDVYHPKRSFPSSPPIDRREAPYQRYAEKDDYSSALNNHKHIASLTFNEENFRMESPSIKRDTYQQQYQYEDKHYERVTKYPISSTPDRKNECFSPIKQLERSRLNGKIKRNDDTKYQNDAIFWQGIQNQQSMSPVKAQTPTRKYFKTNNDNECQKRLPEPKSNNLMERSIYNIDCINKIQQKIQSVLGQRVHNK